MLQAKTPGEISLQHWYVGLHIEAQLDPAVVGSGVAVLVVVMVVLVVGVGHPAGNRTKRPTNQNLKRQQCFSNKLINKRLILKKTLQIRNGAHSIMTKYQLPAEHK